MHNRNTAQSEPVAPFGRSAVPPELRDDPIVVEHFPVVSYDGRTVGSYTVARCGDCGATRRFLAAGMASGWSARHRGLDDTATLDEVCPNRLEAAVAALSR